MCAKIEAAANRVFKTVQGKRHKIADNYLSLKAYAVTWEGKIKDYVSNKGKGRGLSSIGDLLTTVVPCPVSRSAKPRVLVRVPRSFQCPLAGRPSRQRLPSPRSTSLPTSTLVSCAKFVSGGLTALASTCLTRLMVPCRALASSRWTR